VNPPGRFLVLGHDGFIGRVIVERLKARYPKAELNGRSIADVDLTGETSVEKIAPLLGADSGVVMLAAMKRQLGDSIAMYEQNMRMVANLGRAIERNPPRRVVFFSSTAVYGEDIGNTAITEDTPANLRSFYGLAKLSGELLLGKVCSALPATSLVCVRPPTVYGPGEKVISYGVGSFLKDVASGGPIKMWGDGSELREMIFVEDLADLVARLFDHAYAGALNIVAGHSYTFKDVLDGVRAVAGRDVAIETRARSKDKVDNAFDNRRLCEAFPDFRFTPLTEGIKRTAAAQGAA
jgi:UDP-glucose 4-epimerase